MWQYTNAYGYDKAGNRTIWRKDTNLGNFWSNESAAMPTKVLTDMTSAGFGSSANPALALNLKRNYVYDAANRLTSWTYAVNVSTSSFPIQTNTYVNNSNGNRITKKVVITEPIPTTQQTSYVYDYENGLKQLTYSNVPGVTGTDTAVYNSEGRRIKAVRNGVETQYLYDGNNVLIERDGGSVVTKTYTRGLDEGGGIGSLIAMKQSSGALQYYQYDPVGSVSKLTNSTGAVAGTYTYDAFGNLTNTPPVGNANRYEFSTKEFDTRNGLYYFGARYYDPEVGRWLTPDSLGLIDGLNLYVYVNNNPLNLVDPYGFMGERAPHRHISEAELIDIVMNFTPIGGEEKLLGRAAENAIKKIRNIIGNHLKPSDIEGAMRDMLGKPVIIEGKIYNHLKEVSDALNGLRRRSAQLENETAIQARKAYNEAINTINDIVERIKGIGL